MADNKQSREVDELSKGCGNKSCYCDGTCRGKAKWNPFEYSGGDNEVDAVEDEGTTNVGELTVKVSADVGEALTGFKALQRELRETTRAARELEQAYKDAETAIAPTVHGLQTQALKDAVRHEANIPDKLRDSILAKFAEDEAKIAELERKIGDWE